MGQNGITLVYVCNGLLFIILGIPLVLNKIGPNSFYGFRTAKSLSDPKTWYAVNHIGGIDVCIAGVSIILGSLLFRIILRSYTPSTMTLANAGMLICALACVVIHFIIVMKRY